MEELRQMLYEKIIDQTVFIARASEGAVSADWLMEQPIFIRNKLYDQFIDEVKERKQRTENRNASAMRKPSRR